MTEETTGIPSDGEDIQQETDNDISNGKKQRESNKESAEEGKRNKNIEAKAPKNKTTRRILALDAQMSQEKGINTLFKILGRDYDAACNDETVISDAFSVKDLRIIAKVLSICDTQEIFSQRKPVLVQMIREFISQPQTVQKHQEYLSSHEKAGKPKGKARGTHTRKSSRAPKVVQNTVSDADDDENDESQDFLKDDHSSDIGNTSTIVNLKPVTLSDSKKALETIKKFNKIIWDISARVTELEKAMSNLLVRIAEAEKLIN